MAALSGLKLRSVRSWAASLRCCGLSWIILLLASCGGGTSGSGLKTYQGRVITPFNEALSEVAVTIEDTGDSSVTDVNGRFSIKSNAAGATVRFLLESPDFTTRFTLIDIPDESSRIGMRVTVNPQTNETTVKNLSVRTWMAGYCEPFFESREVIRQIKNVPDGTECSLNVRVLRDGQPVADLPIALQYSSCEPGSSWQLLRESRTGTGNHQGAAELNFGFIDSSEFCRYRVIAPYNGPNTPGVPYPIDTFTEQEFFGRVQRR